MHEMTVTRNILSTVLEKASEVGAARIDRVCLKVGQWATVEPDCLRFYFDIVSRGTIAEEAELAVEVVPVRYSCAACGAEYSPTADSFACPKCCGVSGTLVGGRELYIESIEVRHEDSGHAPGNCSE